MGKKELEKLLLKWMVAYAIADMEGLGDELIVRKATNQIFKIIKKERTDSFKKGYTKGVLDSEYGQVESEEKPDCLHCGTKLIPVKDRIAKKFTGHLWKCPKCKINISRG